MITLESYRTLAQALPGVTEQSHHGMPAFAVGRSRFGIFDPKKGVLAIRLPHAHPDRAGAIRDGLLEAAPGSYGAEGWVSVDMERIDQAQFAKLLEAAHAGVGAKKKG
jgi:hypothetical protein